MVNILEIFAPIRIKFKDNNEHTESPSELLISEDVLFFELAITENSCELIKYVNNME